MVWTVLIANYPSADATLVGKWSEFHSVPQVGQALDQASPPVPLLLVGIAVPSTNPVFLTIVAMHIAVGLGAIGMLSAKGPARHPLVGTIDYWCCPPYFLGYGADGAMGRRLSPVHRPGPSIHRGGAPSNIPTPDDAVARMALN